jgi:hypothetical protein
MEGIETLLSVTLLPWVMSIRFDHDRNGLYNGADDM